MTPNERFAFFGGFICGAMMGMLVISVSLHAFAFDDPGANERQGFHRCDSPSGWCSDKKEPDPCGRKE